MIKADIIRRIVTAHLFDPVVPAESELLSAHAAILEEDIENVYYKYTYYRDEIATEPILMQRTNNVYKVQYIMSTLSDNKLIR